MGTDAALADRVGHQAGERTLTQLTDEQPAEEVELLGRRPVEDVAQDVLAPGRRAAAGRLLDAIERVVDVGDGERRRACAGATSRLNTVAQPTPMRP